jgi:hypothetical protein
MVWWIGGMIKKETQNHVYLYMLVVTTYATWFYVSAAPHYEQELCIGFVSQNKETFSYARLTIFVTHQRPVFGSKDSSYGALQWEVINIRLLASSHLSVIVCYVCYGYFLKYVDPFHFRLKTDPLREYIWFNGFFSGPLR